MQFIRNILWSFVGIISTVGIADKVYERTRLAPAESKLVPVRALRRAE